MAEQSVRIEDRNGVRIITIDRERRSNALDVAASAAIDQAIDTVLTDPASRTPDLGGKTGTKRFGALVAEALRMA